MRLLLTGANGQVGHELATLLRPQAALAREQLDLRDGEAIRKAIRDARPDVILNAAAYTQVDKAEAERDAAFAVNAAAPGTMAQAAASCGALLVHFSTDYVFDGEKAAPYVEDDAPRPLSVYGESKLAGERAIQASGCRHLIFRTSWVYSARGRNFLLAIRAAALAGRTLRVVDDQRGAPTSAVQIAHAVARVLAREDLLRMEGGLFHLSAGGATTWHGFAEALLRALRIDAAVAAIPSAAYPAAARRPKNSLLDNGRLRSRLGIALESWQEGLEEVASALR